MNKNIWVIAEVENNTISAITFELLGKARSLAAECNEKVEALLIGDNVAHLAKSLISFGADRVHIAENPIFANQIDEHLTDCAAEIIKKYAPSILLVGATVRGRAISARLAAKLNTGLTADCTALAIDTEEKLLLQSRPAFGGNLMATIKTPSHTPQMASVRPGIMCAIEENCSRTGEVVSHNTNNFVFDSRIEVIKQTIEEVKATALCDSKIIIGVGRGVKSKTELLMIEEFASKIGAVVAGSRAAVEVGLIDATLQIGQTGHTIAPELYIAIGISGQIQHTAAISGAKTIIAINKDASAPIFNCADFAYVATIEEILPKLIKEF